MKKIHLPAALVIVAGLSLSACNAVLGGPSNADIEAAAREQMIAGAGPEAANPALKAAADAAKVEPHGLCNSQAEPGKYVCMVKVTSKLPGQPQEQTQDFVVKLSKGDDGKWKAVD